MPDDQKAAKKRKISHREVHPLDRPASVTRAPRMSRPWRDVGWFGRVSPSSSSSTSDRSRERAAELEVVDTFEPGDVVASGWGFTVVVRRRANLARVRGGIFRDDIDVVDARLGRAVACACARDVVWVATEDGWFGRAFVGDERFEWRRDEGVGERGVAAIEVGDGRSMIALDGEGAVWERGLARESEAASEAPVLERSAFARRVRAIAFGANHGVFVTEDGAAWTFGWNVYGTCGLGRASARVDRPERVESLWSVEVLVSDAACGDAHTLLLTRDGHVYAFGSNRDGQLGVVDVDVGSATATPALVDDLENVEVVRCGARHSAAVVVDDADPSARALYLWGANARGQCADSEREIISRPRRVIHRRAELVVSLGQAHTSFA